MFDVKAKTKDLVIKGFSARFLNTGSKTVNIYYKSGTYVGNETNSSAWTFLESVTVSVSSTSSLTTIPMTKKILIQSGKTYGIYINFDASYTTGSGSYSNTDLSITTGAGLCGLFSGLNSGRIFNGSVAYCLAVRTGNDAGVFDAGPRNFCAGTQDITAIIKNYGNNQITSLKINWTKDGVLQTPVTYSGTLDTSGGSGSETDTVKLGSQTFGTNSQVKVKIWTSNVNSASDTINTNDTLTTILAPALKGTFTVGGTSPDYATLTDAVKALTSYGLCGAVTFNIRPGTYNERLVLGEITGASATNTITFDGGSPSSVTLKNSGSSMANIATVLLDGADYVTIKNMRIEANGASYAVGVHFANSADHNTLTDNFIYTSTVSNTNIQPILGSSDANSTSAGDAGDYNLIANNTIRGGYYGIRYQGTSSTSEGMYNSFVNNDVSDFYTYGMYIYYQNYVEVLDNKSYKGTTGSGSYAAYLYYPSNFIIERNQFTSASYTYLYYANYSSAYSSSFTSSFSNNMVIGGSSYALYFYYGNHLKFQHNSIYLPSGTYGVYGYNYPGTDIDMRNNIIAIGSGTAALYLYNSSLNALDYNIYQGPISITGTIYSNLAAWQGADPNHNQHSLDQNPGFKSSTDLHLDNSGVKPYGPDLGFATDVDGDSRCSFAPTIGADESILGKTARPTAGLTAPDTIFAGAPAEILGNVTANVPHKNLWYVNGNLVKDSLNLLLTLQTTGTYTIKVVAQGCSLKDSASKTVVVVNPSTAPDADFIVSENMIKPGEVVTFSDLSTGGATQWHWEISPSITYDINGNAVDAYKYVYADDSSRVASVRFDEPGNYKVCLTAVNSKGSDKVCKERYVHVFPVYTLSKTTAYANDSSGFIYDDGGESGNYSANTNSSMLLAPCASEVYLVINRFELECGDAFLRIYDGDNNTGKPLHPCTTNTATKGPGLTGLSSGTCSYICRPSASDTFVATSGHMYLEMSSGSKRNTGFEAFWWRKPKKISPPKASFDFPSTICIDIPVRFTNTTTGEPISYLWDLDGDMSQFETTSQDASFAYFVPGKYEVTLIAANCGGADTFTKEITVIKPSAPGVSFVADNTNPTTTDVVKFAPNIKECVSEYFWRFTPGTGSGQALFVNKTTAKSEFPEVTFTDTGCYNVFLYAKNSGGEDSLQLNCFITVKNPYCEPTVTTNIPDIGISEVVLHTLDNKSSQGVADYQNFVQSESVTLETGVKYDLTIKRTSALNPATRTAWIDWNLDGDFDDAGEKLGEEKAASTLSWTKSFTVPTSAKIGASVLRVAINQGSLSNVPCGPNKYGEFEDYRVYITPDLTAPVITLIGSDTVYVEQGYAYTDSGATAADNLDGNITALIKKSVVPTFDNLAPGTYYFKYTVQDAAGNAAEPAIRVVIVTADKTPPALVVSGADTQYVAVSDVSFVEPVVVSAEDLVDGDLASEVIRSGNFDVNQVGVYTLNFAVADFSGNNVTIHRTIIVEDTIAPVITLAGTDTVYHEVNTPYVDAGATASDNYYTGIDKDIITTGTVDITHPGTYVLSYSLADASGNKAQAVYRVVIVRDTKAPHVALSGDSLSILEVFDTYNDPGVIAQDNYGSPVVTTSGTFYTTFPDGKASILGDYTIKYTATDSFGNSTDIVRTVRVVDTKAPVIELKGPLAANVCRWAAYTDAGYDLSDNYWPDSNIVITPDGDFKNTLEEGVYSLRYKAVDKSGNVGYSSWRLINILPAGEGACATGLTDGDLDNSVSVYPNPTTGHFYVALQLTEKKPVRIEVINALGEIVVSTTDQDILTKTFEVDLSTHAGGVYMLRINVGNQSVIKKVIRTN
jgi:PKD repeat protein